MPDAIQNGVLQERINIVSGRINAGAVSGRIGTGGLSGSISIPSTSSSQDLYLVSENTTDGWNNLRQYIPKAGEICVYTDYAVIQDDFGNDISVPGIKVGDGNAYLIDMPFVGAETRYYLLRRLQDHENNTIVHITQAEREFWNNKLNYDVSNEELILTRN